MIPAADALTRLKEGNARYVAGRTAIEARHWPALRFDTVEAQQPFAVILGCADSRVPVELVFDQGMGDLFVVRVAGNVAASTQLGSIEYAVQQLQCRLVVVLGHQGCGAVEATLQELDNPTPNLSPNIQKLVGLIRPATLDLEHPTGDQVVPRHARLVAAGLLQQSEVLAAAVAEKGVQILAAVYELDSGRVVFGQPE